jgi:regulator of protease activity HflC (stomatin/prohibitin superfamily)
MSFIVTVLCTIVGCFVAGWAIRFFWRLFGLYTIVQEGTANVYVLFGKVLGVIAEPGLHSPLLRFGPGALIVNLFGKCSVVDMRLDQEYLRSQPVNSEEGAPMGVGIWFEMAINDPVAYLFKNADPRGSLRANVSNAAVRSAVVRMMFTWFVPSCWMLEVTWRRRFTTLPSI